MPHRHAAGRAPHHIDHVVQLVGPEHVALGLDFGVSADDLTANFAASPARVAAWNGEWLAFVMDQIGMKAAEPTA